MESSVLQMGNRKCFVAVVVFVVDGDDLYVRQWRSLISFVEEDVGGRAINS